MYTSSLWYTPRNESSFTCTLFANVYTGVALLSYLVFLLLLPRGTLSLLEGVWVSRTVSLLGVNDLISFASRAVKEMEGGDRPQAVDPPAQREYLVC